FGTDEPAVVMLPLNPTTEADITARKAVENFQHPSAAVAEAPRTAVEGTDATPRLGDLGATWIAACPQPAKRPCEQVGPEGDVWRLSRRDGVPQWCEVGCWVSGQPLCDHRRSGGADVPVMVAASACDRLSEALSLLQLGHRPLLYRTRGYFMLASRDDREGIFRDPEQVPEIVLALCT